MKKIYVILFPFLFIYAFAQQERLLNSEKWEFYEQGKSPSYSATIPGTVHLDLMKNNLILDPFKDENEKSVQWIENKDWCYQTTFLLSEAEFLHQNIELEFLGLDTFADIFLNGKLIKSTDNMFRTWTIPVKNYLIPGKNALKIQFKSSVKEGNRLAKKIPFDLPETPRSVVRKAQYQFGWDWGPRLVTTGIWKAVKLRFWDTAIINSVLIEQKNLTAEKATLIFHLSTSTQLQGEYTVNINEKSYPVSLNKGIGKIDLPYEIISPQLWQPNGWGKPHLYHFTTKLLQGGETIDSKELTTGIRSINLIQKEDKQGESFYFEVNGKPLYAKGANWIPADSFTPRISKEKYKKLIEEAKNSHFNMIRVWGGGIYEDDEFYKLCDENGILVWQDFMFAGSFYPSDEAFIKNVKQEVRDQVTRLHNHPSIALWCGNNEVLEALVNWGYQKKLNYNAKAFQQVFEDYSKIFQEVIPEALYETIPFEKEKNLYWPTSPEIGWGHPESLTQGDSHYWGVWWGEEPFEIYNQKVGRFMSEYGFQGMPAVSTFEKMFKKNPDLSLKNKVIRTHEKNSRGWEIITNYLQRDYPIPKDFSKFVYVSQLLQARGMKIAIEAHRRNTPYNMGSLYWQLNDCWPVVSWSSIDYYGNLKALQYQVRRSFEPISILAEEKEGQLLISAINDGLEPISQPLLEISVYHFNKPLPIKTINIDNENSLERVLKMGSVPLENLISEKERENTVLKLVLKNRTGDLLAENTYYFSRPKDLQLQKPNFLVKKISEKEVEITTDVVAKDIYLDNKTGNLSDNFFDLFPGEKKIISCENPINIKEIISLYDILK